MRRIAVFGLQLSGDIQLSDDTTLFPVGSSLWQRGHLHSLRRLLTNGVNGINRSRIALEAAGVDDLYRRRDRSYLAACDAFLHEVEGADAVIFFSYPFLHPELILRNRGRCRFVMGFVDDPHSTYLRGLPYAWAYDAVFFISPSYSEQTSFDELLALAGVRRRYWLPLVQAVPFAPLTLEQVVRRQNEVCYVGNPTYSKMGRLADVRQALGNKITIRGRWPMRGYAGLLRPLIGEKGYFARVTPISSEQKRLLYIGTKIAMNMHVSDYPAECGNMRTYEAGAHGMLLVSDRGARNLQNLIFRENDEAIYYDNLADAIDKCRYFLAHDEHRSEIAYRAHLRTIRDYSFDRVWGAFCSWIFTDA